MNKKLPRKLMAPLLAAILALTALSPAAAYAGNNQDTDFGVREISAGQPKAIGVREKTNESSVYVRVNGLASYCAMWPVAAVRDHNGSDYNRVSVGAQHWTCSSGRGTFMPGLIYEKGYRYASVYFENLYNNNYGFVTGVWSPDSVGDPYSKY